jgi:lipopolysaccharide/colanic/teichoic acid biosynthesis glycosyltransferase
MKKQIYNFLKRLIDILVSFLGITILSPILIIIIALQLITYKTNIFFNQKRVGLNGKIFKVFKFKTMSDKKDSKGILLPDNLRVTKLGKILRTFSLDEIPQILNIVIGQMSVVGPRPQSIEVCLFMTKEQFSRHSVKPGLTGLSAINGRNKIPWTKKIELDLNYIKRRSIFLDLKIILITAIKVILREGVFSHDNLSAISLGEELLNDNIITQEMFDLRHSRVLKVSNNKLFTEKDLLITNGN